jgi:hypothetical protein
MAWSTTRYSIARRRALKHGKHVALLLFNDLLYMSHEVAKGKLQKNIEVPLGKCVKVIRKVIWHYVLRRDLEVLSAPALLWLWFG